MYIAWHTMSFSHTVIFGLFYCRFWPPTTGRWHILNNSGSNGVCLLVMSLSMRSNAFVNGTRMSGICAFIAVYFEYEHTSFNILHPTIIRVSSLAERLDSVHVVCLSVALSAIMILLYTPQFWSDCSETSHTHTRGIIVAQGRRQQWSRGVTFHYAAL